MPLFAFLQNRLWQYALLVRLHRPIGILLLLWPCLWALWMAAEGPPQPLVLLVFLAGVVLMRSAGCAINDFADRDIDPRVRRTQDRPLAAGLVSPAEAIGVFVFLSLIAFVLVLQLNLLTILLSIPAVGLAASYPFTKRYTSLPQAYLGIAFGWGIPMAFAAQTGSVPPTAWLLFGATVCWAMAYDTLYAMVDREDDLKIGVRSSAILFGRFDRLMVGIFHVLVLLFLLLTGWWHDLGHWFYLGLLVALVFPVYQQVLIWERKALPCFRAFVNNHWFGGVVFIGIAIDSFARPV